MGSLTGIALRAIDARDVAARVESLLESILKSRPKEALILAIGLQHNRRPASGVPSVSAENLVAPLVALVVHQLWIDELGHFVG